MKDKNNNLPKLYQIMKQYEDIQNNKGYELSDKKYNKENHNIDLFGKAYELVLESLDQGNNRFIHESLEIACQQEQHKTYEDIISLTLSTIHRINFTENDKNYCSTLFIAPYFTITDDNHSNTIHYPPVKDIEAIFKKHFFEYQLIDDPKQLHIPGIKISSDNAYEFDFSDWFRVHKESLIKTLNPHTDQFYTNDISIPIANGGDLSFFPILIMYEDNDLVKQPAICDVDIKNLPFEDVLSSIEKDVEQLSGTGSWAVGTPSHCENALDFGLEIQQDFALDSFFKTFMQRDNISLAFFPLEENDMALLAWNNITNHIESVLELSPYSQLPDEFKETIIEQIYFYEMSKSYLFEKFLGFNNIDELDNFNLNTLIQEYDTVLVEATKNKHPTLH